MDLERIHIFTKVVQSNSFSRAAQILNLPKSTVSKAITRLEHDTGTKLLVRTTRSLTLTASGRAFFESCLGPIQQLEDAQKSLQGQDSILKGLVRITAPEDLGARVIAPVAAELSRKNCGLSFELKFTDDLVDLVRDGFDLAIRLGKVTESNFKTKRLGQVFLVPVAAPGYLAESSPIRQPADLTAHACLTISNRKYSERWILRRGKKDNKVVIQPRVACNQMSSLMNIALHRGGIALIPHFLCKEDLKSGRLVRVLPDWTSPGIPVTLISPLAMKSSVRLKVTSDSILDAVQTALRVEEPS